MGNRDIATYIAFGFSFITAIIPFIGSGHLWKPKFFKKCLIAATVSGFAGIVLELTSALGQKIGMTIVVMFTPLIYLAYFQLFRWMFKRWKGTEPYVTSFSSTIGSPPLDLFTLENKDGKMRKFNKERKIMASDFAFSFLQALFPAYTILGLILLVTKLND